VLGLDDGRERRVICILGLLAPGVKECGSPLAGRVLRPDITARAGELCPVGLRAQAVEAIAPADLLAAEGRDHDDALAAQTSREESDEVERRAIRPMDVLEHQQHRSGHRCLA
jgi:hypothetical protein